MIRTKKTLPEIKKTDEKIEEKKSDEDCSSLDANDDLSKKVEVDLTDKQFLNKKVKKNEDFNDKDLRIININDEVKAKLIANDKGYFVDIRKYYKGYPTKKGIRILATKFVTASEIIKKDVEELFEHINK